MKLQSTIQQKIMRIVLVTSGVVVFLTCSAFVAYQFFAFKENEKTKISTLGEIIAANSTAALAFDDVKDATETLQALMAEKHIVAACLYDTTGKVFARYPDTIALYNIPLHPAAEGYKYIGTYLEGFAPVVQGNIRVGTLYLKSDLKAIYQTTLNYIITGMLVFGLAILVAYLLSRRLQRSVSEPILSLSKTAENISIKQNYSERAKRYEDDELGLLTDAFNNMLDQIERQNEEITSFNQALEMKVNQRTAELEKANLELKLQTEFSEAIIDSSVDVIAVFDTSLNYMLLNKSGREIYNVTTEQVLGKNIAAVFPQIEASQMYRDLQQAVTGVIVHNPNYKSQISNAVLENFFIPLRDADNQVYSVLVIGHDITAIIEGNEKLKKLNLSLEHSNRDLEQFAYVASHDLQEPLRKIQIFSSQLQKILGGEPQFQKTVSKVISSASRMADLITGVLHYSKLGNVDEAFVTVSLAELVRKVITDFELIIDEKQAQISVDNLPEIAGNELQLNQLFSNLMSNSLKFSDRTPVISISSSIVTGANIKFFHGLNKESEYVSLLFKDNGIGFSQEYAHNLFSVFQRLHSKEEYPGTGIGLALCKKIVDNHNGHITVNSELGEGTMFCIYLPLHRQFTGAMHSGSEDNARHK
ncbi:ATP-binding protein [Flavitalea sp.]|nr:ATP-binding protein [Flavitalea sp.]